MCYNKHTKPDFSSVGRAVDCSRFNNLFLQKCGDKEINMSLVQFQQVGLFYIIFM